MRWINTLALVPLTVVLTAVLARLGTPPERRLEARRPTGAAPAFGPNRTGGRA